MSKQIKVYTESGSIYLIDESNKTWERVKEPSFISNVPLRSPKDTYQKISPIEIGKSLEIIGPPFHNLASSRLIVTSPVVRIEVQ